MHCILDHCRRLTAWNSETGSATMPLGRMAMLNKDGLTRPECKTGNNFVYAYGCMPQLYFS